MTGELIIDTLILGGLLLFSSLAFGQEQIGSYPGNQGESPSSIESRGECHPLVRSLITRDREDEYLVPLQYLSVKAPFSVCRASTPFEEVERRFQSSKGFAEFLSKQARFAHLGPENQFDQKACSKTPANQPHEIAGKFYYLMSRVELGQAAALAQIAALDRVLGEPSVPKLDCGRSSFERVRQICTGAETQGCRQVSDKDAYMKALGEKTVKNMATVQDLQSLLAELTKQASQVRNDDPLKANLTGKIMRVKSQIQMQIDSTPWIVGKVFQAALKAGQKHESAVRMQLKEDRSVAKESYFHTLSLQRCLNGKPEAHDACDLESLKKLSQKTGQLGEALNPRSQAPIASTPEFYSNVEMSAQRCLLEGKVAQVEISEFLTQFRNEGVLLVATAGLSTVALTGRFLVSRALMAERNAAALTKMAQKARIGIDGTSFAVDTSQAISLCQSLADDDQKQLKPKDSERCEIESVYQVSQAADSFTACMSSIAFGLSGAGRLTAGQMFSISSTKQLENLTKESRIRVQRFIAAQSSQTPFDAIQASRGLKNSERIQSAETLFGSLEQSQKQALIKAHESSGSTMQKARTLRDGGFSRAQVRVLMQSGLAGKPKDIDKMIEKLQENLTKANWTIGKKSPLPGHNEYSVMKPLTNGQGAQTLGSVEYNWMTQDKSHMAIEWAHSQIGRDFQAVPHLLIREIVKDNAQLKKISSYVVQDVDNAKFSRAIVGKNKSVEEAFRETDDYQNLAAIGFSRLDSVKTTYEEGQQFIHFTMTRP